MNEIQRHDKNIKKIIIMTYWVIYRFQEIDLGGGEGLPKHNVYRKKSVTVTTFNKQKTKNMLEC